MADHVCPWWAGYILANPLRRLIQPQEKILGEYVKPGMTVLDVGCAMGYFSLWMARTVGDSGQVVCVDVQERMIRSMMRRAKKAGLENRIDARVCDPAGLGIDDIRDQIDFALAFAVAHEVPDVPLLFKQIHCALKEGGKFLLSEPSGHVSVDEFEHTETHAKDAGFKALDHPKFNRSRATLFSST